jgi:hypothetical protein
MVKVTGGQRLDIFGIKKEDLPAVWADLNAAGMVSGHAYGKSLRTVKTCVGSEWCRFGTQDSTGLGVKIERMTWGSAGCRTSSRSRSRAARAIAPRRRSRISAWSASTAATSSCRRQWRDQGPRHRLLCKVATEQEAMDYCAAFIQLYREEARYLERTAPWIERVGRRAYQGEAYRRRRWSAARRCAARFLYSQSFSQDDPWAERAAGAEREQHAHMAEFKPARRGGNRMIGEWLDIGWLTRSRCAARAPCRSRAARRSRCSAPATTRSSRSSIAARTRRAAEPGDRPRAQRRLPAAQLEHRADDRRGAGRATRAARRPSRSRSMPAAC